MIEADSQAVLNILTEHYFLDALINEKNAGNLAYKRKGTTSRALFSSSLEINFLTDGSTSLGNYEWLFVFVNMPYKQKLLANDG
jgi:hypothetical protein